MTNPLFISADPVTKKLRESHLPARLSDDALTQKIAATTPDLSEIDNLITDAPMMVTFGMDIDTDRPATTRSVMWIGYGVPTHRQAGDIVVQAVMEWPANLDLIAWYDATTAGPTGDVLSISDRGPNSLDMVVKAGGSLTVESGGINPSVFAFDGGIISTGSFDPTLWAYPLTVYLVASVDDTGSDETLFDTTHPEHKATIGITSAGNLRVNTSIARAGSGSLIPRDTPMIISVSFGTDGFIGEMNGVRVLTATDIPAPTDPVTRLRLGGNWGGSFVLNGTLGEVIIARDPTPSDHTSTLDYLSEKWGITL